MIFKMARYTVRPENLNDVKEAIQEFVAEIKENEPATFYETYQEAEGPTFVHLMCFENEEAEDAHKNSSHTNTFVDRIYPICENPPIFTSLSLLDSSEL
jgi:quinol monooxygenase YgiN